MSAASVTFPVHFVDATRDAIRAYSRSNGGRSSRASSHAAAPSNASSRRSSGASLATSTKSNASSFGSSSRKQSSYRASRVTGSSVKAPVIETLYSGNSSGQTTPSGQSLASSASSGTQPSFLTKSNDWTTTGNSTDRSSVFSLGDWGEDEFDRAATRKVKSLFEDVDSWMFEQRERVDGQGLSQTSRQECVEWSEKFLHCRTLGTQLIVPKDGVGYEMVAPEMAVDRPATGSFLIDVMDNEMTQGVADDDDRLGASYSLCLTGKAVVPIQLTPLPTAMPYPVVGGQCVGTTDLVGVDGVLRSDMSHLVEEIFEQDGKIEEYLAYDARKFYPTSSDVVSTSTGNGLSATAGNLSRRFTAESKGRHDDRYHRYRDRYRHQDSRPSYRMDRTGLPPITPTACLRDSILSGIFDVLWSNYLTWIQHLLQRYHAAMINVLVYKQLSKSGVGGLPSRSAHVDHATAALLAAKTVGVVEDPYNRLVMTADLRRANANGAMVDYAQGRVVLAGEGNHGVSGGNHQSALSSQSSASFVTSVPAVGMVGVGLDSVVRPSSRLSTLTSRYTSFSNVGQSDQMATLDGVLTISSKALHYQHKQQQQQQQPPMTPSSQNRSASSFGSHGLQLPLPHHQPDNHHATSSSSKTFSGSIMHVEDNLHHHHHQISNDVPFHVMNSVQSNHNNNNLTSFNSGPSSTPPSGIRGLSAVTAISPSAFHHPTGRSHVTSIATISLISESNNVIGPISSALGHNNNTVGGILTSGNRNHQNFRSAESTPPTASFLLSGGGGGGGGSSGVAGGGTPSRASAVGPRGRSRTHLQPLDRAKSSVASAGDDNDLLNLSSSGFPVVSGGLEMVRGIGIANSASPPLGLPRNLPPLDTDVNNGSRLNNGSSKRKNSIRASSAFSDKNHRNVTSGTLKNRAFRGMGAGRDGTGGGGGGPGPDDRPNTTHAFRTDLVHYGSGNIGGTPSSNTRRPLSPHDPNNRHSKTGVSAAASTATITTPHQQLQQITTTTSNNNTAMGFGVVGQSEDKPIMLTGISLTPFHAHPLESHAHRHPSEEDEDIFVGGNGMERTSVKTSIGDEPTSWNRAPKSPGNQRHLTSGQSSLRSRGRLGPLV